MAIRFIDKEKEDKQTIRFLDEEPQEGKGIIQKLDIQNLARKLTPTKPKEQKGAGLAIATGGLSTLPDELTGAIGETTTDIGRYIAGGALGSISNLGALAEMEASGELAEMKDKDFDFKDIVKIGVGEIPDPIKKKITPQKVQKSKKNFLEDVETVAGAFKEFYGGISREEKFMPENKDLLKGSFLDNPSAERVMFNISRAAPSLLEAAAVTSVTKSPTAGGMLLGFTEVAPMYEEAKEELGAETARTVLHGTGLAVGLMESLGLDKIMKGKAAAPLTEGLQEVGQDITQNFVKKIGWDKTQNLIEGIFDSFLAGFGLGFSGAGISRIAQTQSRIDNANQEGVNQKEVDNLINFINEAVKQNKNKVNKVVRQEVDKNKKTIKKQSKKQIEILKELREEEGYTDEQIIQYIKSSKFNGKKLRENILPSLVQDNISKEEAKNEIKQDLKKLQEETPTEVKEQADITPEETEREFIARKAKETLPENDFVVDRNNNVRLLSEMAEDSETITEYGEELVVYRNTQKEEGEPQWEVVAKRSGQKITTTKTKQQAKETAKRIAGNMGEEAFTNKIEQQQRKAGSRNVNIRELRREYRLGKVEPDIRTEPTVIQSNKIRKSLNDRLQGINKIQPKALTKAKIRAYQQNLTDIIRALNLPAKDKAKFLTTIKEANTPTQVKNQIEIVKDRAVKYYEKQEKRYIRKKVKRELKYTKPVKKGRRRVGKYDYQSNKLFKRLRKYNKMTQAEAEKALNRLIDPQRQEGEPIDQETKIKMRMLSYKMNGMKGSVEIFSQVLEDIKNLKRMGAQVKNNTEFFKQLSRSQIAERFNRQLDKIKATEKDWKTAVMNGYRRGIGNIRSILGSIVGKDLARELDLEVQQKNHYTETFYTTQQDINRLGEIFETDNPQKTLSEKSKKGLELSKDGVSKKISRMHTMHIYNAIKNETIRDRYYNAYGKEQIQGLLNKLTGQERRAMDYLMNRLEEFYPILNKRHIERNGRDLGRLKKYWPSTPEYLKDVYDDVIIQSETPSARKSRVKSKGITPDPSNAWFVYSKYIGEALHEKHISKQYEKTKRILRNSTIKRKIESRYGEELYKDLNELVDKARLHNYSERASAIENVMGKALNNWVAAKIASPTVLARQMGSTLFYSQNMPVGRFAKNLTKSFANPRKTFKFMWKNSDFLEARFNMGFNEAVSRSIQDANKVKRNLGNFRKALTSLVRGGDILAITYGGHAYVRHLMSKGMSKKEAFKKFEEDTIKAQQSPFSAGLSKAQNAKTPLVRYFTAFLNSNSQAARKMMDSMVQYHNNETSAKQVAKTLYLFGIQRAVNYAMLGAMVNWAWKALWGAFDWEDEKEKFLFRLFDTMATTPVNALPFIDGLVKGALRMGTERKVWDPISMPVISDINNAYMKLGKEDKSFQDWLEALTPVGELGTGAPIGVLERYFDYAQPKEKEKGTDGLGGELGGGLGGELAGGELGGGL